MARLLATSTKYVAVVGVPGCCLAGNTDHYQGGSYGYYSQDGLLRPKSVI
jgi:hypothetical protein